MRIHARDALSREFLDGDELDESALRRNLTDIRRINALLGWTSFTTREVARVVNHYRLRRFTLLDVAAGSADIVVAIARWAARASIDADLLATDINPRIVAVAREQIAMTNTVRVACVDALALPYPAKSFDIALCTLALHHFDSSTAIALLRNMSRVARHVLVFDVVRSRWAHAGAVVLTTIARMDKVTQHDAPLSVRRAYRGLEVQQMAAAAGLRSPRVWVGFPFRLAISAPSD